MDRLFLDANVLFSAARSLRGKIGFLFVQPNAQEWTLLSSEYAVNETRRNLALKFPQVQAEFETLLVQVEIVAQPQNAPFELDLPEKDRPIWHAAFAAKATHLLTGDLKDFGKFMNRPKRSAGIVIQTVADYLRNILEEGK